MEADFNAIGILFAPAFGIFMALIWGTKYNEKRFLKAVLIPLSIIVVLVIVVEFLPPQLKLKGALQLHIPILSLFPILLFVEKKTVIYAASLFLIFLAIVLSIQYAYLCQKYNYSFDEPAKIRALDNLQRASINMMLYAVAETDSNVYPAGWLSESAFVDNLPEKYQQGIKKHCKFERMQTVRLWHSPLTHLYKAKKHYQELWYPGGKLSGKTFQNISLKERWEN
ncbi:MAG: hypothetical protein BWY69_00310 [Planctomycetes bacterium ADurb.Bin401]|nr:MAG: hypothetical protein BWY69_00310 [Planctomycetes bacterium ADurb.Bin401]